MESLLSCRRKSCTHVFIAHNAAWAIDYVTFSCLFSSGSLTALLFTIWWWLGMNPNARARAWTEQVSRDLRYVYAERSAIAGVGRRLPFCWFHKWRYSASHPRPASHPRSHTPRRVHNHLDEHKLCHTSAPFGRTPRACVCVVLRCSFDLFSRLFLSYSYLFDILSLYGYGVPGCK